jgi:hypothetical protein
MNGQSGECRPTGPVHGEQGSDQPAVVFDHAAGIGPELAELAAEEGAGLLDCLSAASQVNAENPAVEVQPAELVCVGRSRGADSGAIGQGWHAQGVGVGDEC